MSDQSAAAIPQLHAFFFSPPIENKMLGHIMAEIYRERVYDQFFEDRTDLVVLDIGANVGMWTYYAAPHACVLHALEPSTEHFLALTSMVQFNHLNHVHPHKLALSHQNGTSNLSLVPGNATMHSLIPGLPSDASEEVETVTLDKLLDDLKLEHVDVLKLDVEGAEMEILGSEGFRKVADRIDLIVGENHSWNGRNPAQLETTLRDRGFAFEWIANDAQLFVARRIK